MTPSISKSITATRFPLILGPVLIHCGDYFQQTSYNLFFSEIIGRITVPLFFVISGYLFFQKFDGSRNAYKKKMQSRVWSLLIPYVLWNTIAFVFYWIIGKTDIRHFFQSFWVVNYHGGHSPADGPLWFLRTLIIIMPFIPIIYWINKKRIAWMAILSYFCLFLNYDIFSSGTIIGFICFNLGTFLALNESTITNLQISKQLLFYLACICFVVSSILVLTGLTNRCIKMVAITCGAVLYMMTPFFFNERTTYILSKLSKFSFFIFCLHEPLVPYFSEFNTFMFGNFNIGFTMTVLMVILFCILIYKILPTKFLKYLCGGR